jgi:hypothetical protein
MQKLQMFSSRMTAHHNSRTQFLQAMEAIVPPAWLQAARLLSSQFLWNPISDIALTICAEVVATLRRAYAVTHFLPAHAA